VLLSPWRAFGTFANRQRCFTVSGSGDVEVLVDLVGIEPTTSSMPWKRAPSCATGPFKCGLLYA
jgi:hypothetical protein